MLKYYIGRKEVTKEDYVQSFVENAANELQTAKTAKKVIAEDEQTATNEGHVEFRFDDGLLFSIVKSK